MRILSQAKPADSLTLLFLFCLTMVSLYFHDRIPHVTSVLTIYSALFLIQVLFIRFAPFMSRNRAANIVRGVVFPVACVLLIFDSLEFLVHTINPKDIDPSLIRLDYLLLGGYPTVMLESLHARLLTDILQLAYASYYLLPISLGLLLNLKGREREFDKTVFLILLCFYLSYIGYLLFPALGPRYTMDHLQSTELRGLFVAEPIQRILNEIEGIKRDAFPSGHTAVVLVVAGLAYRFEKGFFSLTLPVIILLIFSTVYCRYHYVVDVIGGALLAAITFFIGDKYYGYWETRNNTHH
ncbi:MAG TPA: phosphatase PAP2 family protein [Thermodesulfovibrionales bacterium]|nr:phosphatase PAP2 family protein [Thermodesulfovibrionales bacterium]